MKCEFTVYINWRKKKNKSGDDGGEGETRRQKEMWSGRGSPADLVWRGNCIAKDLLLQV